MRRIAIILSFLFAVLAPLQSLAGQKDQQPPPASAKCPICGMFVARYPEWVASLACKDGGRYYFDGPKDLFRFYMEPGRYVQSRKQDDIADIRVKDYYSLAPIDGRKAYYVIGGNVRGPMGRELIPFAGKSDAEGFMKDHSGKKVLRFNEITPAVLKGLD
ncbi:MAG TPA: nitrous oxide reductase accessory protein NosL [Geobacteraceae bacterium]|nr:nitrous oxide reductase accessory protein NosL [Geobacteraceae bacterium]